jgi:beta-lactamase superfamily II metal-dependent hydrolase
MNEADRPFSLLGGIEVDVSYVRVDFLWCDQGMAHLIQVFDKTNVDIPAALMLVDFGVEVAFKSKVVTAAQAAPAVAFVIDVLKAMVTRGLPPRIEYVVVSHQDTDHWGMFEYLLAEADDQLIPLRFGKIYYGGTFWGESAKAMLDKLAERTADAAADKLPWTHNWSDYRNPKVVDNKPTELAHIGAMVVRTLIVNAPIPSSASPSFQKNGSTAILVVEFRQARYILPGDATYQTLEVANKILEDWEGASLAPTTVMAAPHHGALATMVRNSSNPDFATLADFVFFTQPESVVASAGVKNQFKHPYRIVLTELSPFVDSGQYGSHAYVTYRSEIDDWQQETITAQIYTTVISHGVDPVRAANWYFASEGRTFQTKVTEFDAVTKATVKKASEATMVDVTSLALTEALPVSRLEALMRPSPVHRLPDPWLAVHRAGATVAPRRVIARAPQATELIAARDAS